MKGFTRTFGQPTPKEGYSLQYTTDYFGNNYHRYMPETAIRISKHDNINYKKLTIRLARTFVFTLIAYGLCSYMLKPAEYVSPLEDSHTVWGRLSPVRFTDEELETIRNKYTVKTVEAKNESSDVMGADEIKKKILTVFGEYGDEMLICMQSENGRLNPVAKPNWNKNGTRDFGLMRINSVHCARHGLTQGDECKEFFENIDNNLAEGKRIFDARKHGFSAWYAPTCRQFHNLNTK